jgi:phosphoserine phosphatase RsbU/P
MPSAAFLAILADAHPFSAADWRWAICSVGISAILLTIGLIALGVFFFRNRVAERVLLYFGIFVVLYAVRVFLRDRAILSVFAIPPGLARHVVRTITFTIGLASLSIILEVVQARWRTVFRWALAVQLTFTVLALLAEAFGVALRAADIANNLLVLASWVLLIVFLFFLRSPGRMPGELRVFAAGLAVLGVFVLHANLASLHLVPGADVEPVGFIIFVSSLGYLVARRIFAREESLVAIEKELQIAQQIQTSILPREVPRLPGLEIAARYLPMSAVAGDFYDFLHLEGHQLGILVADVTGHGVPAALIASMLKVALASQSAHAADPARVLSGLNQALCGKFEDHFVTAAYLFADLDAQVIRYAGAGHPPVLFGARANGKSRTIEQNGLFLGMFPEATYQSIEMRWRPGDRYVLYTDGLPESRNSRAEEFGLARCLKVLDSHGHLPVAALADQLLGEISTWTAGGSARLQEDDMTLIVIDCQT